MNVSSPINRHNTERLLGLFLLLMTIGVYLQVKNHEFIYFDDPAYVTENRHVQKGLTKEGLFWAFTTFHASNWHPLTWLSHMLDCHLYGLNPTGHHLTSLFFHVANSLLLFLVLRESTGRLWQSFLVAGLFALHPLHVESVAWVSERKDVLSTFFWMLTLLLYVRYTQAHGISRYVSTLLLFALGLLSKPMVVTLPFVLILLDYWPLGRVCWGRKGEEGNGLSIQRLLLEKIPFFVLSGASCIVTYIAQSEGRAIQSLDAIPLQSRILNALVSYVSYMAGMVWPHDLAVFYPHPVNNLGWWAGLASALFLLLLCIAVLHQVPSRPYLSVGWFWFLGSLIPVIGLVQVGMQALADRYTYIPLVGLFVAMVWGLSDFFKAHRVHPYLLSLFAGVLLLLLTALTWTQLHHWQNTFTLFQHTLRATKDNYAAHFILARAFGEHGRLDKAFEHYNRAVEIHPAFVAMMHNRVGYYLAEEGQIEDAISQFKGALEIRPDYPSALNNLGVVLARMGRLDEAISQFAEALKLWPGYTEARKNLENVRREKGLKNNAESKEPQT